MIIRFFHRHGSTGTLLLITLLASASLLSLIAYFTLRGGDASQIAMITHQVERGEFLHEVTERGEIESSRNIDVRCEVKGLNSTGTAILEVVEEGTRVKPGDVLVKLDSSVLEKELVTQQIACNTCQSLMIQARNEFEAATIAKKEYLEGTFLQEEQTLHSAVFVAEENLRRAQQYLNYSERLAAKGYVTDLQLEGDRFAVEKSLNELDAARTKLRVLQEYTKPKMVKDLETKIESGKAKFNAEQSSLQLEMTKRKDIEDQIAKCTILAPAAGQVVYSNEDDDDEFVIQPGAMVRERQVIIRLPDPAAMQVKAKINESNITLVKVGMQATIRLDAIGGVPLRGEVTRVNEYPESSGWFRSQVKEYATEIVVFDPPPKIRPGLTASVQILVERQGDVITAPVQAVHEHGGKYYCMVESPSGWEAREVTISSSNDKFIVIDAGLDEKVSIAMDPRKVLGRVQLPELDHVPDQHLTPIDTQAVAAKRGSPKGISSSAAVTTNRSRETTLATVQSSATNTNANAATTQPCVQVKDGKLVGDPQATKDDKVLVTAKKEPDVHGSSTGQTESGGGASK